MAFTYDASSVSTDLEKLRLLIHDTDSSNAIFQDGEINAFLSIEGSDLYRAASLACRSIAASASRCAIAYSVLSSSLRVDRKQVPNYYLQLAEKYETRSLAQGGFDIQEVGLLIDQATGTDETDYKSTNDDQDHYLIGDYLNDPL